MQTDWVKLRGDWPLGWQRSLRGPGGQVKMAITVANADAVLARTCGEGIPWAIGTMRSYRL